MSVHRVSHSAVSVLMSANNNKICQCILTQFAGMSHCIMSCQRLMSPVYTMSAVIVWCRLCCDYC